MSNTLLDIDIILPSGVNNKDKINLFIRAITPLFAEMLWLTGWRAYTPFSGKEELASKNRKRVHIKVLKPKT